MLWPSFRPHRTGAWKPARDPPNRSLPERLATKSPQRPPATCTHTLPDTHRINAIAPGWGHATEPARLNRRGGCGNRPTCSAAAEQAPSPLLPFRRISDRRSKCTEPARGLVTGDRAGHFVDAREGGPAGRTHRSVGVTVAVVQFNQPEHELD